MPKPSHKVLLVDDDPAMLRFLEAAIVNAGYEVRTACDAATALRMVEEECPAFIVTDWMMPGMSGLELCQAIRQRQLPNYVYLMVLTAKSSSESLIAALESGADDFVTKPVQLGTLMAKLHSGARVIDLERQLTVMAQTDPLTGLLTRRAFFEQFEREISRARRYSLPLAAVMFDIDYFKKVNDTHGHAMGDEVLRVVSGHLRTSCRASDYICRYGGEEFCVLLTETSEDAGSIWSDRVRESLAKIDIPIPNDQILNVTASLGIAQLQDDIQAGDQLVDLADQALLVAKQSGRDRVIRYSSLDEVGQLELAGSQSDPFEGVPARSLMTSLMSCIHKDESVGQAADFFLQFRINSSPVIDDQGKLVGILSEKDVMAVMMQPESWSKPVSEVMQRNVVFYDEETPVKVIYNFLCRVTLRRVVIVRDGWPTGIISRGSFLRWHCNWLSAERTLETSGVEDEDPKGTVRKTAKAIAEQATRLSAMLEKDDQDFLPVLVDGATRLQEYVNDLLADSRNHMDFGSDFGDLPAADSGTGIGAMLGSLDLEDSTDESS